jgi:hypothetical protein
LVKATLKRKTPYLRAGLGSAPVVNSSAKAVQMMDGWAGFFAENRPFRKSRNDN